MHSAPVSPTEKICRLYSSPFGFHQYFSVPRNDFSNTLKHSPDVTDSEMRLFESRNPLNFLLLGRGAPRLHLSFQPPPEVERRKRQPDCPGLPFISFLLNEAGCLRRKLLESHKEFQNGRSRKQPAQPSRRPQLTTVAQTAIRERIKPCLQH